MSTTSRTRTALAGALALATVGLATVAATPASAAVAYPTARFAPISAISHAKVAPGYNQNGYNWSGYARHASGFKSVVSNWVEPHVTCNSNKNLMAPWVGIDGYGSKTVEQTGVATWCDSGTSHYAAWYEMYPAGPKYYKDAVSAGDHFTARVTRSGHTYTMTITNKTKHWTKKTVRTLNSAKNVSAEVIIESPTASYPNFGKVAFGGAKINGRPLAALHPLALDATNGKILETHTSKITKGTAFGISFKHA